MRPRTLALRLAGVVGLLALPVAADAPADQYERFDRESELIEDRKTRLDWDRYGVERNVPFNVVTLACQTKSALQNVGRVPTVKELLTIVDEDPHDEYENSEGRTVKKAIDRFAFPGTPVDSPYWTSTPAGQGKHWVVWFDTGLTEPRDDTAQAHLRCVR